MNDLVEIRVPTYRRRDLLRRCLRSLISQTHENWIAIVLDDSPEMPSRCVVDELCDERIQYSLNRPGLGCCGNIDLAFRKNPFAAGQFFMVLEDDNWLNAECLRSNIQVLRDNDDLQVLLRNQLIVHDDGKSSEGKSAGTTRGDVFGGHFRRLRPIDVRSSIFFSEGLSNGGIVWTQHANSQFVVGPSVRFSPMQEFCRSLQLSESVGYAPEPLANFSLPLDAMTSRESLSNRRFNRGKQEIVRQLLRLHGEELLDAAAALALTDSMRETIWKGTYDALWLRQQKSHLSLRDLVSSLCKGLIKFVLVHDPLSEYWATGQVADLN